MAKGGERRLLFDTRGRRKHVIRVVYAILALLMGASLFLVVGPVNIGSLLGNSTSEGSAAKVYEEQAERIETRLARDPTDEGLLLALTRARIGAGNAEVEVDETTGARTVPISARRHFEAAGESWDRYLKQTGGEANASAAQLVGQTFFTMAESGAGLSEVVEYVAKATEAQEIAVAQQPTLGSLSTLAIYQNFNGEFAAAEKTTGEAAAKASSKAEGKTIENQLAQYRKRGEEFAKQKKKTAKFEKEAGKEKLTNPFGGLTGGAPGSVGGG
jgi:hypothetical protein